MPAPFERAIRDAIAGGIDYLLSQQDEDGFWREFDLAPGPSEAWTTAWVGWCLSGAAERGPAARVRVQAALARACRAVMSAKGDAGWGYNRRTGADADSTAWALRFCAAQGVALDGAGLLAPYVDAGGGVHTFVEPGWGRWTDAHDDVAANAGLALLAMPKAGATLQRIVRRVVECCPGHTFWWSTQAYGIAWGLRLLSACPAQAPGGLPPGCRQALDALPRPASCFDVAHRLLAALALHDADAANGWCAVLLDQWQSPAWPGSPVLLVPDRTTATPLDPQPEMKALLTTSICVRALSEFLRLAGPIPSSAN
ncbi:hypothetical protein PO883_10310 [Massilia sp. DJPM01]|uniref:hypothetical protein n=1 Tax=Massilia sp. DJPM01 TaxID=3024404 RepID=UPI00259E102E|nr:hypothetical protein [Massilia sp. DJPM01]MDM5177584.1 hypothetical protein [Massilia sp. DJPM01]